MNLNLAINNLPAPTFGFLKLNGDVIDREVIAITDTATPLPERIPEGLMVQTDVSFADAQKMFEESARLTAEGDTDYSKPNGDTYGQNAAQTVHTGMGVAVDKLLQDMNVPVCVITAAEGVEVEEPLVIHYGLRDGDSTLSAQVIYAAAGSELTVIMDYKSGTLAGGFHGVSTKILAEEGAKVHLVKVQSLGEKFLHIDDLGGVALQNASIDLIQMELGAAAAWTGSFINLLGSDARFDADGGYLTRKEQHLDQNYITEQRGKRTECYMHFKGVMMDTASKTLRYSIDFRNGCNGAYGEETEDVLLLSEDVVNRSMPLILCQEDDIQGEHGATIGRLNDDELFYMESRGIAREDAERMIVRARLKSIARKMPDCALKDETVSHINRIMKYESDFNDCDDLILCEGKAECEELCE